MTQLDDHGDLPAHADRLLRRLEDFHALSVHGSTMHMQHVDHAKRARQLAEHLRGILALSDAHRYPSALALVRATLEHHLMDRLIFLATRHVETYGGVTKDTLPAEEAKLRALQVQRPDLERWWWDESGMNVVWRGYHSERSKKGRGQTISPYYFRIDDFDPFTGGKKHYAFLSGYVHPSKRGYEALHGANYPDRLGEFDHYRSEIVLLYVITIAAAELGSSGGWPGVRRAWSSGSGST